MKRPMPHANKNYEARISGRNLVLGAPLYQLSRWAWLDLAAARRLHKWLGRAIEYLESEKK